MKANIDYSLYLVTDRALMSAASIEGCVERAILGGCTVVQLREKDTPSGEFYAVALRLREITARYGVPLIINDRADIALAADADGVHIGQDDLPYSAARRIVGADKLVGVSVSSLSEAVAAAGAGADYLGVGAMFPTGTKTDGPLTVLDELRRIREAVELPIVVIGGINKDTLPRFAGIGIDGAAIVSAIVSQPDETTAARGLKAIFEEVCRQ